MGFTQRIEIEVEAILTVFTASLIFPVTLPYTMTIPFVFNDPNDIVDPATASALKMSSLELDGRTDVANNIGFQIFTQWLYNASKGSFRLYAEVPLLTVDAFYSDEYLATARIQPTKLQPSTTLHVDVLMPYNRTVPRNVSAHVTRSHALQSRHTPLSRRTRSPPPRPMLLEST